MKIDRLTGQGAAESLHDGLNGLEMFLFESNGGFAQTLLCPNACNRDLSFFFGLQAHYTRARRTRHVGVHVLSREVQ